MRVRVWLTRHWHRLALHDRHRCRLARHVLHRHGLTRHRHRHRLTRHRHGHLHRMTLHRMLHCHHGLSLGWNGVRLTHWHLHGHRARHSGVRMISRHLISGHVAMRRHRSNGNNGRINRSRVHSNNSGCCDRIVRHRRRLLLFLAESRLGDRINPSLRFRGGRGTEVIYMSVDSEDIEMTIVVFGAVGVAVSCALIPFHELASCESSKWNFGLFFRSINVNGNPIFGQYEPALFPCNDRRVSSHNECPQNEV